MICFRYLYLITVSFKFHSVSFFYLLLLVYMYFLVYLVLLLLSFYDIDKVAGHFGIIIRCYSLFVGVVSPLINHFPAVYGQVEVNTVMTWILAYDSLYGLVAYSITLALRFRLSILQFHCLTVSICSVHGSYSFGFLDVAYLEHLSHSFFWDNMYVHLRKHTRRHIHIHFVLA